MLLGLAWFGGGAALTAATVGISNGTFIVAFWGAVLAGALQFFWGAIQWITYQTKNPEKKAEHHLKVDVKLVLRSMLAVAVADGKLDDSEVAMIQVVSSSIFGDPLDERTIRSGYENMAGEDFSMELASIAKEVTPSGAELALKAAAMVAFSDGTVAESEKGVLRSIAFKLGIATHRYQSCLEEARELFDAILSSDEEEGHAEVHHPAPMAPRTR